MYLTACNQTCSVVLICTAEPLRHTRVNILGKTIATLLLYVVSTIIPAHPVAPLAAVASIVPLTAGAACLSSAVAAPAAGRCLAPGDDAAGACWCRCCCCCCCCCCCSCCGLAVLNQTTCSSASMTTITTVEMACCVVSLRPDPDMRPEELVNHLRPWTNRSTTNSTAPGSSSSSKGGGRPALVASKGPRSPVVLREPEWHAASHSTTRSSSASPRG
mmetsp:Transcript_3116/g.6775  ORF Transcript_3116/g.6775 Transcript_3116/m.6775 type:complete len:217 (-) Transcript_3116:1709-2359(-)